MLKSIGTSKPIRMWIDGRCYVIKEYQKSGETSPKEQVPKNSKEEQLSSVLEYLTHDNGQLYTQFRLPSFYYTQIQRFAGFDLKKLSNETQTKITIPQNKEDGHLIVTGENKLNIETAANKMFSVIAQIRIQNFPLQFIAIPLLSNEIKENFVHFKNEILSKTTDINGMEESIFQSPLKLHLTVVVFTLLDEIEKSVAINALEDYKTTILNPLFKKVGPLKIHVAGIDCMNNNLNKVDVLYAKAKIVNETQEISLQKIVNDMSEHFYEKGLLKKYQPSIKLHMTLINTKYRKTPNRPKRNMRYQRRQSFDATYIMEKFKDFEFGISDFNSIHLCYMSSVGEDGFYMPLSIIELR